MAVGETEREDERGAAKRPDLRCTLSELDVPEWAELALDKVEWRGRIALLRDRDSGQCVGFDWERGDPRRGRSLRPRIDHAGLAR
jgi:hypothetical protein